MASFLKRQWFPVALVVLAAVIALMWWKPWQIGGEPLQKFGQAADFELENINGDSVSLSDFAGKTRLVYFFFSYCPDVCPPTTAMLSKVQENLKKEGLFGDRAVMFSISFDPTRDTPERLREFSGYFGADASGWHFLRGDEAYIQQLAKEGYRISVIKDEKTGNFLHQNYIVLVDPEGEIRKWYNMGDPETASESVIEEITRDVKRLAS